MCTYVIYDILEGMTVLDVLFGAMDSTKYCWWFYVLSVIGFVMLVITGLGLVLSMAGFVGRRGGGFKKNLHVMTGLWMSMITYALLYFTNRLLFSMCAHRCSTKEGATFDQKKEEAVLQQMKSNVDKVKQTMAEQQKKRDELNKKKPSK